MKTITNNEILITENKNLIKFFAFGSILTLGILLSQNSYINLSNLNPFNNTSNNLALLSINENKTSPASVTDVVTAALAFKSTLTTTQQATLEKPFTTALSKKWSNLPCGANCRNGIQFSTLTASQLTSALSVIATATGTGSNTGYDQFTQILKADAYLGANGGGAGYSAGIYFISFLNTPSTTGAWMLQFGGHHYAFNIAFNNGQVIGTTPQMVGVEPLTFTTSGVTYAPMTARHDLLTAMLSGLTATQLTSAKLTTNFMDCLMSPGESNGNMNTMPVVKQGLICSGLSTTQKNSVLSAIEQWTKDMDTDTATALISIYSSGIDNTYIAWTGNGTSGNPNSFLSANSNYVRIDGPNVWIEFVCQNGFVFSGIHYHSVWRDHVTDYGSNLTGPSINSLAINDVKFASQINIYPNPATDILNIQNENNFVNATLSISDLTGRIIFKKTSVTGLNANLNLATFSNGTYILKIEDEGKSKTSKFIKK